MTHGKANKLDLVNFAAFAASNRIEFESSLRSSSEVYDISLQPMAQNADHISSLQIGSRLYYSLNMIFFLIPEQKVKTQ